MSSDCTNDGQMHLVVTFKLGTDLDIAQVQVQNRVAIAQPQLPADVRQLGVTVKKSSPDITLAVLLYSPDNRYDTVYLSNYGLLQVRDQLARLPGVGDVQLFGARDYAMRLWLNPEKLAARNLTAGDVVTAIQEQNVQVAAGVLGQQPLPPHTTEFQLAINAQGRLSDPAEFGQIILKTGTDGSLTRVKDVARVDLGAADYSVNSYINGYPSVAIPVFQLPGTNSIETADAIYKKMEELKRNFPPGMDYSIPYDTTLYTRVNPGSGRVQDAGNRDWPGRGRGAGVSAKLAREPDPVAGGAGVADRNVRDHEGDGVLDQQPFAVRDGVGDRDRGG